MLRPDETTTYVVSQDRTKEVGLASAPEYQCCCSVPMAEDESPVLLYELINSVQMVVLLLHMLLAPTQ